MLVLLSQHPDLKRDVGGMMRRIAGIDSIFRDVPRLYLEVSLKRNRKRTLESAGRVTIECINYFLHRRHLVRRLDSAKCIYVHSAWNGIKLFPYYARYGDRTISDFHGLLPEEETFRGRRMAGRAFAFVERRMVKHSFLSIVVTDQMGRHFLAKYPRTADPGRFVTLPNFEFSGAGMGDIPREVPARRGQTGLRLIYAGGIEKWQNIDLMLGSIRQLTLARPDTKVDIYVPQQGIKAVRDRVHSLELANHVRVGNLPADQLWQEYQNSDAGFVLRDDILLNRVSMPTKLMEYMRCGVVPIVLSPALGDFPRYGYRYLTMDDLLRERPSEGTLEEIRRRNLEVASAIARDANRAVAKIRTAVLERLQLCGAERGV